MRKRLNPKSLNPQTQSRTSVLLCSYLGRQVPPAAEPVDGTDLMGFRPKHLLSKGPCTKSLSSVYFGPNLPRDQFKAN